METILLEIPNAETLKLVKDFAIKNGIGINVVKEKAKPKAKTAKRVTKDKKESNPFFEAIDKMRSRKPKISMAEITKEVEYVRKKRYDERKA